MSEASTRVAVDIGGTFTDLVGFSKEDGRLVYSKSLTTYGNLADGVFDCIGLSDVSLGEASHFVHGSTIAINTVIQRRGALTGLITTSGFGDVYAIGRGNRPDAYNLLFEKTAPLVPRDLIAEVAERVRADGSVLEPIDIESVRQGVKKLLARGVEAIAVALLHSYRNPEHEKRVHEVIRQEAPGVYVSLSHEILREFREFERTSTTTLNAYVGPIVSRYVRDLDLALGAGGFAGNFLIMQSNGGTMSAKVAENKPVTMMESGPVAGVIGCGRLGRALGMENVISFDMGGTTAKASLIEEGEARVVTGYYIGGHDTGHPMMLPVVDIVEVGTGGGSIAWIDEGGGLKVGPLSAGSSPGPVCYGNGGTEPTITDANLVLGRLDAGNFLGGQMRLDLEAARRAIETAIARPLGLGVEEAALGILKIADTKMSLAVREVSVAKGHDPRGFALIATGGAGPLHAVSIARELSLPTVVIPEMPGTFSALGMLLTDVRHDFVRTTIVDAATDDIGVFVDGFAQMEEEAAAALELDGVKPENVRLLRTLDMRYLGQEYTLSVPLLSGSLDREAIREARKRFDEVHHAQYGHAAPEEPVEIVNLRLAAVGVMAGDANPFAHTLEKGGTDRAGAPKSTRTVWYEEGAFEVPVYDRDALVPERVVEGPAVIEEKVSTTIVHPGDTVRLSSRGPLIIEVGQR